jgi:hypothetical protein
MAARLHPEFHAEVIKELYGELECYQLVTERTRRLLRGYSPEHLEAVGKYLPKHLLGVLPPR